MNQNKQPYFKKRLFGSNLINISWKERRKSKKSLRKARRGMAKLNHPDCYYKVKDFLENRYY